MPALKSVLTTPAHLGGAEIDRMFSLFLSSYEAVTRSQFESDLAGKHHVLLLKDDQDVIWGFTTLAVLEVQHFGRRVRAIFSGDTLVHRDSRGSQRLAFSWLRYAGAVKAQAPSTPLYWFLIVKGDRTYRYLPAFFNAYYPNPQGAPPAEIKSLMDHLATLKFGSDYRPERGIIEFPSSRGHLCQDEAELRFSRPEAKFFLECNPGYQKGDELVCLTELSIENLASLGKRQFQAGFEEGAPLREGTSFAIVPICY